METTHTKSVDRISREGRVSRSSDGHDRQLLVLHAFVIAGVISLVVALSCVVPSPAMAGATSAHSAAVACPTWSNGGFGNFVTHGSNVSGCDLAGEFGSFDFGGATAVGTNFSGFGFLYSTLGGANFTDANLSGANLSLVTRRGQSDGSGPDRCEP